MGQRITAISFEADGVQVVTVQSSRSGLAVERILALQLTEFDAFLSLDTAREYLVAINPADIIFETIQIPPTDKKLEGTLIQAEATRLHSDLGPFSCGYRVLGDLPSEGRIIRKVACCLISHQTIVPVLEPFIRHNKIVSRMIATPHILSALVADELGDMPDPVLCAHDDGQRKTLFLYENGAVSFSRSIASNDYGWDPLDRQNVAMTIDYCSQALRIRPTRILVLNPLQEEEPDQAAFPLLEHLPTPLPLQDINSETLTTALVPLALAVHSFTYQQDLLPAAYRSDRLKQKLFTTGFLLFTGIALVLSLLLVVRYSSITSLEETIKQLRAHEGGLVEAVQVHQTLLAEQSKLQPLLAAVSEIQTAADIPHTLVLLDSQKADVIRLTALTLKRDNATVTLTLAGTVTGTGGYAPTQERFEAYIASLQGIRGLLATRKTLDPKAQTFSIEAVYKP